MENYSEFVKPRVCDDEEFVHPTMIEFMQNEIFDRTKLVLPCDGIPLLFSTTKKDSHGTVTQAVDGDVYQSMTCCCARIHLAIELSS